LAEAVTQPHHQHVQFSRNTVLVIRHMTKCSHVTLFFGGILRNSASATYRTKQAA
jgi:hypothetical protein